MKGTAVVIGTLLLGAAPAWSQQLSGAMEVKTETQIQSSLRKDPDLKNNRIDVQVDNGVATLKGTVDTTSERAKAERLARVGGVVRVDNQLEVGSEGVTEAVTDSAVTTKLKAELLADETLRHADVSVTTNNGVVTLSGTVPSEAARHRAVQMARDASGVRRVEDQLRLSGAAEPMAPR